MKLLIVEDDAEIAANVGQFLETRGYELDFAYSGTSAMHMLMQGNFDLVILDLMLPGLDGIQVCRQLRERGFLQMPILMLTARDTLQDKVQGFEAGADDYLIKPFSLRELELRIRALGRRQSHTPRPEPFSVADLKLDTDTKQVQRGDKTVMLKPQAFRILEYLMRNHSRVVSRQELIEHIWGMHPPEADALRVHIHHLRQKIDKGYENPLIHTVVGVGYRLSAEP